MPDKVADSILAFFRDQLGRTIEFKEWPEPESGFYIETDAGASFTFEIFGTTKDEVARAYFDHIRSVHAFVLKQRSWRFWNWRRDRAYKERSRKIVEAMDAFALTNLQ